MRRVLSGALVAVVVMLAGGCGGGSDAPAADPTPDSSPSSTAPARTLRATCPMLEQATPKGFLPSDQRLAAYSVKLQQLATAGDLETRNAVAVVQAATTQLQRAEQGQSTVDALQAMTDAIGTLADRCQAAGSSAFQ